MDKITESTKKRINALIFRGLQCVTEQDGISTSDADMLAAYLNDSIIVEVRGGTAYCEDARVTIIDHDNNEV